MTLFNLFAICNEKGKFVYEVTDYFGPVFTVEEMEYWLVFRCIGAARLYNVDIQHLSFTEMIDETHKKIERKRSEIERLGKVKRTTR